MHALQVKLVTWFLLWLALVIAVGSGSTHASPEQSTQLRWPQRGLTFTSGKYCPYVGFDSALSDVSLTELASTGANFVAIVVTVFQEWPGSTEFLPRHPLTASDSELEHVITLAHRLGLRVMLKPHVDMACALGPNQTLPATNSSLSCRLYGSSAPICGTWRGCIGQQNGEIQKFDSGLWDHWFSSYTQVITGYAQLAQRLSVAQFSIGCELQGASSQSTHWRRVATAVRRVFSGALTYASNWGGDETSIQWWDAVDVIGVDAYYPLPNANCSGVKPGQPCEPIADPTQAALVRGWKQLVQHGNRDGPEGEAMAFGLRELHRRHRRPIVFTEVGYCSTFGGSYRSSTQCLGEHPASMQEQHLRYAALIQALQDEPWFHGAFFWNWLSDPRFGGRNNTCLTPQHKSTQRLLQRWYGGKGLRAPLEARIKDMAANASTLPPMCPCIVT